MATILQHLQKRREANTAALKALRDAAETGDRSAVEKWAAVVEFARNAKADSPGWLLANPEWAEVTGVGLPVAAVVPVVGDEPLVGPEAPDPLPAGPRDEV